MEEFKINEFISLRFRYPNTEIYINGKYFIQCKRLILNIPKQESNHYDDIESIDEATELYEHTLYESQVFREGALPEIENDEDFTLIKPEEEFWGHCSNLQVWYEHNYDTRLLRANLAFPLLKQLAKAGDSLAQIKCKEEIIKRLLSGSESVVEYLFVEGYQDYLNNEELLFGLLDSKEAETLINLQEELKIRFKFVPRINRGLEIAWNERKIIHKFAMINRKVSDLDLTNCELDDLPDDIFNLKFIKIIAIGRNPSFNLTLNYFEKIISKLKNLKIIVFSQDQFKNLPFETNELLIKNNIKAISSRSSEFLTLDTII